ncbi:hypothetical protein [Paenibacillus cucumis (ex Kampfer et al. 2016)]|nr:hypothetical protein [Paenibacillus cucumis (ex Kampfer et al. 2016)]
MGERYDFFYNELKEDLIRGMYRKEKNEAKEGKKVRGKYKENDN